MNQIFDIPALITVASIWVGTFSLIITIEIAGIGKNSSEEYKLLENFAKRLRLPTFLYALIVALLLSAVIFEMHIAYTTNVSLILMLGASIQVVWAMVKFMVARLFKEKIKEYYGRLIDKE